MYTIFLSHSSKNKGLAKAIHDYLEGSTGDQGIKLQVFLSEYDIPAGVDFDNYIFEQLRKSDILVLLLTKEVRKSEYVNQEISAALENRISILPVALEPIEPPPRLERIQQLRAYENPEGYQECLKRVLSQKATSKANKEGLLLIGLIVTAIWILKKES
ncbi:toll/interleukin-1 receptor domain-containing protein [Acidobacteria bacterium AH-259-D05]|nr:toll/interleukin-1 receptor domain-containing protein [Acidobacteria bacterium AH-259-D05]